MSPAAFNRTTQKSYPPRLGLVLLPDGKEVDVPAAKKPPSAVTTMSSSSSVYCPPKDRSQSLFPSLSRRTIQKSFTPKLEAVLFPSAFDSDVPPTMKPRSDVSRTTCAASKPVPP